MCQELKSEIRAALYQNSIILQNWPTFLRVVAQAKSFIYLEHKSSSYASKPTYNREKLIDKATKNSHSFNSYNNYTTTTIYRNLQIHS